MKASFFSLFIACFIVTSMFSQANLNDYKYVIVPNKFDFLKEKDKYQLNSLTQFLFNKHGFEAVMEGTDYPEDLIRNRCLALRSGVVKGSGMFKTRLTIELQDCNDKVIYTSEAGESREKEYKTAYNLALRAAFKSIQALNYKYEPNESIASIVTSNTLGKNEVADEIKQLKQEIQNLKKEKEVTVVVPPKVVTSQPVSKPVKEMVVIQGDSNVLYAQEIDNGFQLVDSSPKVVYRIKSTGLNNTYLVEGKSAIVYKKGDDWILEYYADSVLKQDILNIKF